MWVAGRRTKGLANQDGQGGDVDLPAGSLADFSNHIWPEHTDITNDRGHEIHRDLLEVRIADHDSRRRLLPHLFRGSASKDQELL